MGTYRSFIYDWKEIGVFGCNPKSKKKKKENTQWSYVIP